MSRSFYSETVILQPDTTTRVIDDEAAEFAAREARKVRTWARIAEAIGSSEDYAQRRARGDDPHRLPIDRDHKGYYARSLASLRAWMLDETMPSFVQAPRRKRKRAKRSHSAERAARSGA